MAYKIKPNYHFTDEFQTGISEIPIGRFIIVDQYGNENAKWFRKNSNNMLNDNGEVVGVLSESNTVSEAIAAKCVDSPDDYKLNTGTTYTKDEVDSKLSLKSNTADIYQRTEAESVFRTIQESYTKDEITTMLETKQNAFVPAPSSSYGQEGDIVGMIAVDNEYIYRCVLPFTDGMNPIWARVPFTLEIW